MLTSGALRVRIPSTRFSEEQVPPFGSATPPEATGAGSRANPIGQSKEEKPPPAREEGAEL
jgi:hypothetical protein